MTIQDVNGQPPKNIYLERTVKRQIAEMLGMAKGVICDGILNDVECEALKQWLRDNPDVTVSYPGNHLAERVVAMWSDGKVDEEERTELRELLFDLVGQPEDLAATMSMPASFPLDDPPPSVIFSGRNFALTGIFASGSRPLCSSQIRSHGGAVMDYVTESTDYLVIGLLSSPAWIQSTHGRKIQRAMELKAKGHHISVIAEPHWLTALGQP